MATCKTRLLQEDIESILKEKRMFINELFNEFDRTSENYKKVRANFIIDNIDYEIVSITDVNCVFTGLIPYGLYKYAVEELENIKINFMLRFNAKINKHYFKDIDA